MSLTVAGADDVSRLINTATRRDSHARFVVLLALGGIFLDAYDITSLSYGIGDVQRHFHLSDRMTGLVAASLNIGVIVGALAGGWLTDRVGRATVFMADMAFFVVAALAAGFAPTVSVLIAARWAMGFGVGMDLPVAAAFLAEFSRLSGPGGKAERVAAWCPTWYVATSFCLLLILALYGLLPSAHADWLWRVALAFGAMPALAIMLLRRRFMSESPVWAARRGDLGAAVAILRRSYGIDAVLEPGMPAVVPPATRPGFGALLRPPLLRRTLMIDGIGLCSACAYAAVAFGMPAILAGVMHRGRLGVLALSLAINFAFALPGGLLGTRLTRSVPSLVLTATGYALQLACAIALALIGVPHGLGWTWAALACLAVFLFAQGLGPGCQCMVYPALSYPTMLRGTGVGLSRAIASIGTTLALLALPTLNHRFGPGLFWIVAAAPALGLALLAAIRWEVRGYDPDAGPLPVVA